ncbi:MAG: hypothetical protein ACRDOO_14455 [Actinomadura sp.]
MEDDGGSPLIGINPVLMRAMNTDLENVQKLIEQHVLGLRTSFRRAGVDFTPINHLGEIRWWIGDKLPMLKRRQSMTEQLARENRAMGFPSEMVSSEWPGKFASPEEARQRARELAKKYQNDPPGFPPEVWQEIRANQRDPDFAEEFLRRLGPEETASFVANPSGASASGDENRTRLKAFFTMMATASHRGVFDKSWRDKFTRVPAGGAREMIDLFNRAMQNSASPWSADFLVDFGKEVIESDPNPKINRTDYLGDLTSIAILNIVKNPEALRLLLSDERAARKIFGPALMDDPAYRKALAEGLGKALDPKIAPPEIVHRTREDLKQIGLTGEYIDVFMLLGVEVRGDPPTPNIWKQSETEKHQYRLLSVFAYGPLIEAAAAKYDIPVEVLAGVVYLEFGGQPQWYNNLGYAAREWGLYSGHPDKTSFEPMGIQVRTGARALGYDPDNLTVEQREHVMKVITDPQQAIIIAAKILADEKKKTTFANKSSRNLSMQEWEELVGRYNGGGEWNDPKNAVTPDYIDGFRRIREHANEALANPPG